MAVTLFPYWFFPRERSDTWDFMCWDSSTEQPGWEEEPTYTECGSRIAISVVSTIRRLVIIEKASESRILAHAK